MTYYPSSAAPRMMVNFPADAAAIICCSIELLIFALIFYCATPMPARPLVSLLPIPIYSLKSSK